MVDWILLVEDSIQIFNYSIQKEKKFRHLLPIANCNMTADLIDYLIISLDLTNKIGYFVKLLIINQKSWFIALYIIL